MRAVQVHLAARQQFPHHSQELLQQSHRALLLDADARQSGAHADAQERPAFRYLVQRTQRCRYDGRVAHVGVGHQAADADVAGGGGAQHL